VKKAVVVLILVLCVVFSAFAEFGIRIGQGTLNPDFSNLGLTALAGVDIGLTKRLELNVEVMTPIVPDPLSKAVAGFEIGYSLGGNRTADNGYAGISINHVVSLGLFTVNLVPTYLTLRVTPLTVGTVAAGRRENFLPIGVAWNFRDNSFGLFISIIDYDHYITGTWRDYV
jgi:hypothetical protein